MSEEVKTNNLKETKNKDMVDKVSDIVDKASEIADKTKKLTTKEQIKAWLPLALSIVYLILPADIIPDIPVVGHAEDLLFLITGGLNGVQNSLLVGNQSLQKIVKYIKWGLFILGTLAISIIVLLVVVIFKTVAG